jgi:L-asparaginase
MKIHVIYTGGTIGSAANSEGALAADTGGFIFPDRDGSVSFSASHPFHILSENMNPDYRNRLVAHIRSLKLSELDALFITHGTDTLAYTANLLALLLYGIRTPVFLISSDRPLRDGRANGSANIDRALDMLRDGTEPGVYVPYRSTDGVMRVHRGERLLPATDFSDDFTAIGAPEVNDLSAIARELGRTSPLLYTAGELSARITAIRPYPGLRYDAFDLANTDAVLHGTYHSYTASDTEDGPYSLKSFAQKARASGIRVYLAPMLAKPEREYASTRNLLHSADIIPLYNMSFEMAFAYLTILNGFREL